MSKNSGKDNYKEKTSVIGSFRNIFGLNKSVPNASGHIPSSSGASSSSSSSVQGFNHQQISSFTRHKIEYQLTVEQKNDISRRSSIGMRLKTLKELEDIVESKRLVDHTCEYLINEPIDLLDESQTIDVRSAVWRFYKCLVHGQCEKLYDLRYKFLQLIRDHCSHDDDIPMRLDLLVSLTENGKNVEYCQRDIGPFMLLWFEKIISANKIVEFLSLLINLIKYNAAYFDQNIITDIIRKTCILTNRVNTNDEMICCYNLLDVILCYSYLTPESLTPFAIVLCKGVTHKNFCEICWRVMKNLLGTKLGHSCVTIMCHLLGDETNHTDISLLRGSIYALTQSLWGPNRITSLKHLPTSVLPSYIKALECHDAFVGLEVTLSISRLIEKQGKDMTMVTWALVMEICETLVTKYNVSNSTEFAKEIHKLIDCIEELNHHNVFYGDKNKLFRILELCSIHRPEKSVISLISYRAKHMTPEKENWNDDLRKLMENYYKLEKRTEIRIKALEVLAEKLRNYGYPNEELIIESIVLPYLSHIEQDPDIMCREMVVKVLVEIDQNCLSAKRCSEIFEIIERICLKPFELNRGNRNFDSIDVRTAISGLILIFKSKIHTLPAFPAVQAFKLLSNYINALYSSNENQVSCAAIKLEIFEFLLNLRANSVGQIAILNDGMQNARLKYSSFVFCTRGEVNSNGSVNVSPSITQQTLNSLSPPQSPVITSSSTILYVSFQEMFSALTNCLKFEREWSVLKYVLNELSKFVKNKAIVVIETTKVANDLCGAFCDLVERSKNVHDFITPPDVKLSKTDIQIEIFPALSSFVAYQNVLDSKHKYNLIKCLQNGLVLASGKSPILRQCIVSLTICAMEMQDVMTKCLPDILLKLSKISATASLSIPKLEFLSNLILLQRLYQCFTQEQYLSVFAITLPYTNPNIFNEYTVTLAHRVIAMWFLRCRQRYRKSIVSYIIKGLQNNVIQENISHVSQSNDPLRNRSSSLNTEPNHHKKLESRLSSVTSSPPPLPPTPSSPFSFSFSSESVQQYQNAVNNANNENSCQESRLELIEACMDLLASYTFGYCSTVTSKSPLFESILDRSRSETWLLGHKLITVTTSGCGSRAVNNSLCDKCQCFCKSGIPNPMNFNNSHGMKPLNDISDSENEFTASGDSDKFNRRRHQSELQNVLRPMTAKPVSNAYDDFYINSNMSQPINANTNSGSLCCCWCQGWAEILVRRPTGNTSWIIKLQNPMGVPQYSSSPPDDLPDLATIYNTHPVTSKPAEQSMESFDTDLHSDRGFVPISADTEPKWTEAERASSTPPVFKRTSSSPEMEGNQLCAIEPMGSIDNPQEPHPSVDIRRTPPAVPTATNASHATVVRAASFSSAKQSSRMRHDFRAKSIDKSKVQYNFSKESTINSQHTPLYKNVPENARPFNETDYGSIGYRDRAHTITQMSPAQDLARRLRGETFASQKSNGLSPQFVFLQFYYNAIFDEKSSEKRDREIREKRTPILLPKTDAIDRALRNLDLITPYEAHKIGVVYVGPDQVNDKTAILSNQYGSIRYTNFLKGLGTFIKMDDIEPLTHYIGGLDTKGQDGKFALSWMDSLTQVVFHVATLMPTKPKDPNCHEKNRHIGNDFVCIVYNDSGKPFSLSTIKGDGQYMQAIITIEPYEYNSNLVNIQTKEDFSDLIGHFEAQMLSDSALPLYVRQQALHANLGAMVKKQPPQHISNWVQRLKQIKRIKERVTNVSGNSSLSRVQMNEGSNDGTNNGGTQLTGDSKSQYIFPDFNDYA